MLKTSFIDKSINVFVEILLIGCIYICVCITFRRPLSSLYLWFFLCRESRHSKTSLRTFRSFQGRTVRTLRLSWQSCWGILSLMLGLLPSRTYMLQDYVVSSSTISPTKNVCINVQQSTRSVPFMVPGLQDCGFLQRCGNPEMLHREWMGILQAQIEWPVFPILEKGDGFWTREGYIQIQNCLPVLRRQTEAARNWNILFLEEEEQAQQNVSMLRENAAID